VLVVVFGLGSHWPPTTNRFSYRPGPTLRLQVHWASPLTISGGGSGSRSPNDAATKTHRAAGLTNSRTTDKSEASTFTVTGFTASAAAASTFTTDLFRVLVRLIIVTNTTVRLLRCSQFSLGRFIQSKQRALAYELRKGYAMLPSLPVTFL